MSRGSLFVVNFWLETTWRWDLGIEVKLVETEEEMEAAKGVRFRVSAAA